MPSSTVPVGTTPVALTGPFATSSGVLSVGVTNSGSVAVRIGDPDITSSNGYLLPAGASIAVDLTVASTQQPAFPIVHEPGGSVFYGPGGAPSGGLYVTGSALYAVAASTTSVDVITAPGPHGVVLPGGGGLYSTVISWWDASSWPVRGSATGPRTWIGPASAGQPSGRLTGDRVALARGL